MFTYLLLLLYTVRPLGFIVLLLLMYFNELVYTYYKLWIQVH